MIEVKLIIFDKQQLKIHVYIIRIQRIITTDCKFKKKPLVSI